MSWFLSLITLMMFSSVACAEPSIAKPAEIMHTFRNPNPYGQGTYSYLGVDVYEAALWIDTPVLTPQSVVALCLRYDLAIDTDDFVDGSIAEMNNQRQLSASDEETYRHLLANLLPSVKNGDRMTALYVPGKYLRFYHDGDLTGTATDPIFAERFIDIWLSPLTSWPDLRRHLLGQS